MSVWAHFLSFFLFLPKSNCPSVSAFTNFFSTISILLSHSHPFSSCLPCWVFRWTFLLLLPLQPFFLLPPSMSLLSLCFVVPIPLFRLCWLPCLSFSTPFSAALSLFFANRSYFRTISISFFVALPQSKLCPLFPNVTMLYLFFPFFFRVTSFSDPLSAVFFSQVSVRRGFTFSQDRQPVERGLLADQRLRL